VSRVRVAGRGRTQADAGREPRQGQGAEQEAEVPERDVVVMGRSCGQQVQDDAGEPGRDEISRAVARALGITRSAMDQRLRAIEGRGRGR